MHTLAAGSQLVNDIKNTIMLTSGSQFLFIIYNPFE